LTEGVASRRAVCPRCLRAACICSCLDLPGVPLASAVELLILQHPREQLEAKGTARLLHLAIAGSRLLVGEDWPHAPALPGATGRRDLLLYPPTPGDAALPEPPTLDVRSRAALGPLRLVVIDGTWRKSRRMLYGSPWLQSLPRFSLDAPPPSRYRAIRRARGDGQRSTFEAAVLALQALAPDPAHLAALWPVFDRFVADQSSLRSSARSGAQALGVR
jgi:DTW domain-containing protein YfiP